MGGDPIAGIIGYFELAMMEEEAGDTWRGYYKMVHGWTLYRHCQFSLNGQVITSL